MKIEKKIILFALIITILSCAKKTSQSFNAVLIKGPYIRSITQNSATIMWETDVETKSVLEYGITQSLELKAEGNSELKELVTDLNQPDTMVFANINRITITDLEPDTTYYYRIKSLKEPTGIFTFRTAPPPGNPFRFVVYGDNRGAIMGEQENHKRLVSALEKVAPPPILIFNTGDLVFNGKFVTTYGLEGTFKDEWQLFFDVIKPIASQIAYYPVFGNHDDDGTSEKTKVFSTFFPAITTGDATYYSFDIGNVHFVILNYKIDYNQGSAQYNWLDADLKQAQTNNNIKFIIVGIHNPPYTISRIHSSDTNIQLQLVPIFEQYKVDIVFSGHNHQYERTKVIKGGVEDTVNGVLYVVAGGGGAPLYDCKSEIDLTPEEQAYKNICIKTFNYVIGDMDCTSECKITFTVYSPDASTPIDSFVLTTRR